MLVVLRERDDALTPRGLRLNDGPLITLVEMIATAGTDFKYPIDCEKDNQLNG
jgi:hypothetical protein